MPMYLQGRYRVFYSNWKLLWANYKCQGKTYQAVNKCYTLSISSLPSGTTQLLSNSFVLFTTMLFLAIWKIAIYKKPPTAGSAAREEEVQWRWWSSHRGLCYPHGGTRMLFSRGLCLTAVTKKRCCICRWWVCKHPTSLSPDQVLASGPEDASTLALVSTCSTPISILPLFKIPLTYSIHRELALWWAPTSPDAALSELGLHGWATHIPFKGMYCHPMCLRSLIHPST